MHETITLPFTAVDVSYDISPGPVVFQDRRFAAVDDNLPGGKPRAACVPGPSLMCNLILITGDAARALAGIDPGFRFSSSATQVDSVTVTGTELVTMS